MTSNAGKRQEAERILGGAIETVAIDLPEIQSLDMAEVLRAKADEAWRHLGRPLIVEETGLEIHAMNGFPGPLVKWMLEAVGAEGVARVAKAFDDPGVTARCSLLYRSADGDVVASGETVGELVLPARGGHGFGWDPVFLPAGESQTYGELSAERKDAIGHRGRAWRALVEQLSQSEK
ncbi:MAG: non-canonical purine NTP pyrophosphatase [Thermoanaerobaculia bacterium]|nr:non-canonical purine NTP pyrophosphatase [Thermoanaerobaculia bacterium]